MGYVRDKIRASKRRRNPAPLRIALYEEEVDYPTGDPMVDALAGTPDMGPPWDDDWEWEWSDRKFYLMGERFSEHEKGQLWGAGWEVRWRGKKRGAAHTPHPVIFEVKETDWRGLPTGRVRRYEALYLGWQPEPGEPHGDPLFWFKGKGP